jgi:hypothetical protein
MCKAAAENVADRIIALLPGMAGSLASMGPKQTRKRALPRA